MQTIEAVPTKHKLTPEQTRAIRKNMKEFQHLPQEYIEKIIPTFSIRNLIQQDVDSWSALEIITKDASGAIKTYISMINPMAYVTEPLRANLDFLSVIETKHFRFAINQTNGDLNISNRGRDLPRAFYRSEKLRHDEIENLLSLCLAKHYAERDPSLIKMGHTRREKIPREFRVPAKMLKRVRKFQRMIIAGKREAKRREQKK
jgi:hypothetical protein